jgi:Na+/phosphate symporter
MIDQEVTERMIQVCQGLSRMLELNYQGFRILSEKSVGEAEEMKNEIRKGSSGLTTFLISKSSSMAEGREWVKPFLSMTSGFDRISYNLEGIVDRLKGMVRERILFSDRGNKEINNIFEEALKLLRSIPDVILTRNKLLVESIEERAKTIFKSAGEYSEEHEARLIEGVCMPKSSPIYLGLLESLKAIVGHIVEVSSRIISLS